MSGLARSTHPEDMLVNAVCILDFIREALAQERPYGGELALSATACTGLCLVLDAVTAELRGVQAPPEDQPYPTA